MLEFQWQLVVSQFEKAYDDFCERNHEENIFFDYTGVNAEGSSPHTALRQSWTHLLILDAILAYTEHQNKASDMTESLAFQYHSLLRKCIQTCKQELSTRRSDSEENIHVSIPLSWTSVSVLKQSICLDDNTVGDIYDFLVSSPLIERDHDLAKLITNMVADIPCSHNATNPVANGAPPQTTVRESSVMHSAPIIPTSTTTSRNLIPSRIPASSIPIKVESIVVDWLYIAENFSRKCEFFLSQGNNKILSDLCDVSTHCAPGNMKEWLNLLLLDALLAILLRVSPKKRASTCFNQHRVLRECIQLVMTSPSVALDESSIQVVVNSPWDNIMNFSEQYSDPDAVITDPTILRKNMRKTSFRRQQARCKAGLALCESHVFQHLSLKTVINKVVKFVLWGIKLPSLPSAHDSKVSKNLGIFCRTILAAVASQSPTEEKNTYSLSTFCSNVLDLDKCQAEAGPQEKKQRL